MPEYLYQPLSEPPGSDAIALATDARQSRLAICAGAGLSRSDPTGLPDGRRLSELIYDQADLAFPGLLTGVRRDDLLEVADRVSSQPDGLGAVQASLQESLLSQRRCRIQGIGCWPRSFSKERLQHS